MPKLIYVRTFVMAGPLQPPTGRSSEAVSPFCADREDGVGVATVPSATGLPGSPLWLSLRYAAIGLSKLKPIRRSLRWTPAPDTRVLVDTA